MSGHVNRLILVGHVGRDPEIRTTGAGKKLATFALATSKRWTDKASGEKREVTHWHNVVVFNEGLAKVVEQYVRKGALLYIEGESQTRSWDKNGVRQYRTECVLEGFQGSIQMLDRAERAPAPAEGGYGSNGSEPPQMDDEIPY